MMNDQGFAIIPVTNDATDATVTNTTAYPCFTFDLNFASDISF